MSQNGECLTFEQAMVWLAEEGAHLSSLVLYALSAPSKEEVELFRGRWPTLPSARRQAVVSTLTESAEANFELDFNALLRVTMEDEDELVRAASIEGLWEDEDVKLIPPLVHALRHDVAPSARAAAAASLGRFVLMAELDELEERYASLLRGALLETVGNAAEPVEVRRRAVESISYLGEKCVRDIIRSAYEEPDESMRLSAVFAMGRSADKVWSTAVQSELTSSAPGMRYEAARACGELEVKAAVPALIELVSDPDREVQFAALAALGQIGGQKARSVLQRWCRSGDEMLRLAAEDALAELELGRQPLDLFVWNGEAGEEDEEAGDDLDLDD